MDLNEITEQKRNLKRPALNKNLKAICASTWKKINTELLDHAKQNKIEKGCKVRIDSTCVETNIRYSTDATLLWDAVRVLACLIERCRQIGTKRAGFHNHSTVAKQRMLAMLNATNRY